MASLSRVSLIAKHLTPWEAGQHCAKAWLDLLLGHQAGAHSSAATACVHADAI